MLNGAGREGKKSLELFGFVKCIGGSLGGPKKMGFRGG